MTLILIASVLLIVIGAILLVGGLCRAAHNGDEIMRHELDKEELNAVQREAHNKRFRSCIWKILE